MVLSSELKNPQKVITGSVMTLGYIHTYTSVFYYGDFSEFI